MSDRINILFNNFLNVGSLTLVQPPQSFGGSKTASGFRLFVPGRITFMKPPEHSRPLLLKNLKVTFSAANESGEIEIGQALYEDTLTTDHPGLSIQLLWDWTMPALAFYERLRDGREPRFNFRVTGTLGHIVKGEENLDFCSKAQAFHDNGNIHYSRECWTQTLRSLRLQDAVIVEIPFPYDSADVWNPVWKALRDAREAFDAGRSTGWRNCIASVRLALEEWQKIEKEDLGLGKPQDRTKAQRADAVRKELIHFAHFAPHTNSVGWTRDDALFALSTISALLAARNSGT
jgi:hypothetical protein